MNETLKKFGYPDTCVRQFDHWAVLLRPQQVTVGSLVLVCTEPARSFSEVSAEGFAELREVTGQLEGALARAFAYDKINYLMLMMVDPDVHFHVLPRYAAPRTVAGVEFTDGSWPGPPDLKRVHDLGPETFREVLDRVKAAWS
ncbi:MAG: HIT family protein [Deferrisomatales bacterium]